MAIYCEFGGCNSTMVRGGWCLRSYLDIGHSIMSVVFCFGFKDGLELIV